MTTPLQVSTAPADVAARCRGLSRELRDIIDGAQHLMDAINAVGAETDGLAGAFGDDADDVNNLGGALLAIVGRVKGSRVAGDDGSDDKTFFPAKFWGA